MVEFPEVAAPESGFTWATFAGAGGVAEALFEAAFSRANSSLVALSACFVLRSSSWVRFNSFCSCVTRSSRSCERSPHPAKQIAKLKITQKRPAQPSDRDRSTFFPTSIQTRGGGMKNIASIFMPNTCHVEHNCFSDSSVPLAGGCRPSSASSLTSSPPSVENLVKKACIGVCGFVRQIN